MLYNKHAKAVLVTVLCRFKLYFIKQRVNSGFHNTADCCEVFASILVILRKLVSSGLTIKDKDLVANFYFDSFGSLIEICYTPDLIRSRAEKEVYLYDWIFGSDDAESIINKIDTLLEHMSNLEGGEPQYFGRKIMQIMDDILKLSLILTGER